jgi:hypothetical protein
MADELAEMTRTADALRSVLDPIFGKLATLQGYALLIFPPDDIPGFARYVSNVPQARMVDALREVVMRLEQGETSPDAQDGGGS